MSTLTAKEARRFRAIIWDHYRLHARSMPWRDDPSPYNVFISEVMLQQTQVSRVLSKFELFTQAFPTFADLASASFADVFRLWKGLGYNRRALFLQDAARQVMRDHSGELPRTRSALVALAGIGAQTAGAILAYAWNQPAVFIETNIRSVYLHHFFADQERVDDTAVLPFIAETLDTSSPRQWYWALMDYGTWLKQTTGNNGSRSRHYVRQSAFQGSRRQLRGEVLRRLDKQSHSFEQLLELCHNDTRLPGVINDLQREGFVVREGGLLALTRHPHLA